VSRRDVRSKVACTRANERLRDAPPGAFASTLSLADVSRSTLARLQRPERSHARAMHRFCSEIDRRRLERKLPGRQRRRLPRFPWRSITTDHSTLSEISAQPTHPSSSLPATGVPLHKLNCKCASSR